MEPENGQPFEIKVDEYDEFDDSQIELLEYRFVEENTLRLFELAKDSMNETLQKHPQECGIIIDIRDRYNCNLGTWKNLHVMTEFECLFLKLNEIYDIIDHLYFLLMSARYNVTRILLRKWIEMVLFSVYFDTAGKNDVLKDKFIDVNQMFYFPFNRKIKHLPDTSFNDKIEKLYQELSLYAHNEGEKYGQSFLSYYENEFIEVHSKTIEIQSYLEKIIYKNCNIEF